VDQLEGVEWIAEHKVEAPVLATEESNNAEWIKHFNAFLKR
jgi:hypothetical protein